jgi:hypothetical protein
MLQTVSQVTSVLHNRFVKATAQITPSADISEEGAEVLVRPPGVTDVEDEPPLVHICMEDWVIEYVVFSTRNWRQTLFKALASTGIVDTPALWKDHALFEWTGAVIAARTDIAPALAASGRVPDPRKDGGRVEIRHLGAGERPRRDQGMEHLLVGHSAVREALPFRNIARRPQVFIATELSGKANVIH